MIYAISSLTIVASKPAKTLQSFQNPIIWKICSQNHFLKILEGRLDIDGIVCSFELLRKNLFTFTYTNILCSQIIISLICVYEN